MKTRKIVCRTVMLAGFGIALMANQAYSGVIFSFTQQGSDVVMTASGSIDTAGLVSSGNQGWGGTGVEVHDAPSSDIIGSSAAGSTDSGFMFHAGTDWSAWVTESPFTVSQFSWDTVAGTTPFSTYSAPGTPTRAPGLNVRSSDLVGSVWTPDNTWTKSNTTLAALGMNPGVYTVTDSVSGESLTYAVAAIPEPASIALIGVFGVGTLFVRRRLMM